MWSAMLAQAAGEEPGETPAEVPAEEPSVDSAIEEVGESVGSAFERAMEGDVSGITELAVQYLLPALMMLLVIVVSIFVGKFLGRLAGGAVSKRIDETLGKFIRKLIFYAVLVFALLGALGYYGISVASFAAVLAAAGFAVGLAFQGTLSNFAAGVMLLTFRPFKVGDVCKLAGEVVKIDEIDLFTTATDTLDNRRIVFPNSAIFGSTIEVITYNSKRRVDVTVGTSYNADTDQTRVALEKAVADTEGVLQDPEPMIVLWELGGSSVDWNLWCWAEAADFLKVKQGLIRNAKKRLEEAGIEIPFPQMDVHLDGKLQKSDA